MISHDSLINHIFWVEFEESATFNCKEASRKMDNNWVNDQMPWPQTPIGKQLYDQLQEIPTRIAPEDKIKAAY